MKLDEKLVSLRKEKRLTQMKVAEELDVSRQAVSRWESGVAVPSTENLKCLSTLFGVPMDYLLNDEAERAQQEQRETQDQKESPNKRQRIKGLAMAVLIALVCISVVAWQYFGARQGSDGEEVPIEKMVEDQLEAEPKTSFDIQW